jgi:hypothetical protein
VGQEPGRDGCRARGPGRRHLQFGYRFSLDFVPWALLLVALGLERVRSGLGIAVAVGLVAVSIAVNAWGVVWGGILGW